MTQTDTKLSKEKKMIVRIKTEKPLNEKSETFRREGRKERRDESRFVCVRRERKRDIVKCRK